MVNVLACSELVAAHAPHARRARSVHVPLKSSVTASALEVRELARSRGGAAAPRAAGSGAF